MIQTLLDLWDYWRKNRISMILPLGIFCPLAAFGLLSLLKVPEPIQLHNFTASEHPGRITYETVHTGEYQSDLAAWIGDAFCGHNVLLKSYNQLKYSVLKEASGDCMVGKEGYLYSKSQTAAWAAGSHSNNIRVVEYEEYAKQIKSLQDLLEKRGKSFLFLLNPVKAEVCADHLPAKYLFLADQYADTEESIVPMLERALDKYGVNYFDTTDFLRSMNEGGKIQVFHNTGHHWTLDAVVAALNECFQSCKIALGNIDIPEIRIQGNRDETFEVDLDIYDLQNLFWGIRDKEYHTPNITYDHMSQNNVFLFGTSFGYEIERVLHQSGSNRAFNRIVSYRYFTNKHILDESGMRELPFTSEQDISELGIMEDIKESNFVILEQNNIFGVADTHKRWVEYVVKNMSEQFYAAGTDIMAKENSELADFENFSWQEDWGRWGEGNENLISVYSNGKLLRGEGGMLRFQALSYGEDYVCDVLFNENKIGTIVLGTAPEDYQIEIPEEYILKDRNDITFRLHGKVLSPDERGESGDTRKLGLGLCSLMIEEVE